MVDVMSSDKTRAVSPRRLVQSMFRLVDHTRRFLLSQAHEPVLVDRYRAAIMQSLEPVLLFHGASSRARALPSHPEVGGEAADGAGSLSEASADWRWCSSGLNPSLLRLTTTLYASDQEVFAVRDDMLLNVIASRLKECAEDNLDSSESLTMFFSCVKEVQQVLRVRPANAASFLTRNSGVLASFDGIVRSVFFSTEAHTCLSWEALQSLDAVFALVATFLRVLAPNGDPFSGAYGFGNKQQQQAATELLVTLLVDALTLLPPAAAPPLDDRMGPDEQTVARQVRCSAACQFMRTFFPGEAKKRSKQRPVVVKKERAPRGPLQQFRCDLCDACPIVGHRWRCVDEACDDYDLCETCKVNCLPEDFSAESGHGDEDGCRHRFAHAMARIEIDPPFFEEDVVMSASGENESASDALLRMAAALGINKPDAGSGPADEEDRVVVELEKRHVTVVKMVCVALVAAVARRGERGELRHFCGVDWLPFLKLLVVGSLGVVGSRILEDVHIHDIIRVIAGTLLEPDKSMSADKGEVQLLAVRFLKIVTSESKADKRSRRSQQPAVDGAAPGSDTEKTVQEEDVVQQFLRRTLAVHLSTQYPQLMNVLLTLVNRTIDVMSGASHDASAQSDSGKSHLTHTPPCFFSCHRPKLTLSCSLVGLLQPWIKGSLEVAAPLFADEVIRKATSVASLFDDQSQFLHSVLNLALALRNAESEPIPTSTPTVPMVKREPKSPEPLLLRSFAPSPKEDKEEAGKRSKWVRALCRIIYSFGNDVSTRKYTKRLLTAICGSDEARYLATDSFMYKQEFSRLVLLSKSCLEGGAQLPYKVRVDTHGALLRVLLAAKKRPSSWVAFLYSHPKKLDLLLQLCASLDASSSEILPLLLHLLALLAEDKPIDTSPSPIGSPPDPLATSGSTSSSSSAGGNVLGFLRKSSSEGDSPSVMYSLAAAPSPTTSIPSPSAPSPLKWQPAVATFMRNEASLAAFVQTHLLQPTSADLRAHARSFLFFVWRVGSKEDQAILVDHLILWTSFLPRFGSHSRQFLELVSVMLSDAHAGRGAMTAIQGARLVRGMLDAMHLQHRASQQEHDDLYGVLTSLTASDKEESEGSPAAAASPAGTDLGNAIPVAASGAEEESEEGAADAPQQPYYLSTQPCAVCCTPEQQFKLVKLKDLEAETKYTHCSKAVRFKERQAVRSFSLRLGDLHPTKQVKSLEVYFNATPLGDLSEVKEKLEAWTLAKTVKVAAEQREVKVAFAVPLSCCNMLIKFTRFYEVPDALEVLTCPRCNCSVTNKHGICPNCRENAYQCRQCRNINYENLEGFLCNECGYSRYASFHYILTARPCFRVEPVANEAECVAAEASITALGASLHQAFSRIRIMRQELSRLIEGLDKDNPGDDSDHFRQVKAVTAYRIYSRGCKPHFDNICHTYQRLSNTRTEFSRYLAKPTVLDFGRDGPSATRCLPCGTAVLTLLARTLEEVANECPLVWARVHLPEAKVALAPSPQADMELFAELWVQGGAPRLGDLLTLFRVMVANNGTALNVLADLLLRKLRVLIQDASDKRRIQAYMAILLAVLEPLRIPPHDKELGPAHPASSLWERQLRLLFRVFFLAANAGTANTLVAREVLLPLLALLKKCSWYVDMDAMEDEDDAEILASGEMFKHGDGRMSLFAYSAAASSASQTPNIQSLLAPSLSGSGPSIVSRFSRSPNVRRSPVIRGAGLHRSPGARSPAVVMARGRGAGMHLSPSPLIAAAARGAVLVPPLSLRARPTPPRRDSVEAVGVGAGRALLEEVATTAPSSILTWFAEFGGLLPGLAPSRSRNDLCQRVVRKWRRCAKLGLGCRADMVATISNSVAPRWVATLLFSRASAEVRQQAASLLQVLFLGPVSSMVGADSGEASSSSPALKLLDLLAAVLKDDTDITSMDTHEASSVTEDGEEVHHWDAFFQLLHVCLQRDSSRRKQYFVVKGVVPALIRRISAEIDVLHETEHSFSGDRVVPRSPYLLHGLARLLLALVEEPNVRRLFKRRSMAQQALNAHLRLRGLKLERTTLSEECARVLLRVVDNVFTDSDDDKRALLKAYVHALEKTPEADKRGSSFILDQMCSIIKPAKVQREVQVVLKKAPSQEDFIRWVSVYYVRVCLRNVGA
jgi:hypothetical protein